MPNLKTKFLKLACIAVGWCAATTGIASAEFFQPCGHVDCRVASPPRTSTSIISASSGFTSPVVRIAYVIPTNRVAQAQAVERIQTVVTMAQDWFRDQMVRYGYGPRTFRLEVDDDGVTPKVHMVNGVQTDAYIRGNVWGRTINEAMDAGLPIWAAGQVWLLVSEAHLQASNGSVSGGAALGASYGSGNDPGVAMMGGDSLARFRTEFLTNQTVYSGTIIPEVGPYPLVSGVSFPAFEGTTLSSISSAIIGAMIHELGHAFGLPHDFRNDNNYSGNLMGNGCRGIRGSFFPASFTNDFVTINASMARALSLSRYFGNTIADTTKPSITMLTAGTVSPVGGELSVSFQTSDDQALAAAWLEWNFDTVIDIPLSGTSTTVTFKTPYFTAGQSNIYRLCVWDHGGNRRDVEFSLFVPGGSSSAPRPLLSINNIVGFPGRPINLNASGSTIPLGGAGVAYTFLVRGDTNIVVGPFASPTRTITLNDPGRYTVAVRVRDNVGNETESMPMAVINHRPVLYGGDRGSNFEIGNDYYGSSSPSTAGAGLVASFAAAESSSPGITPLSSSIVLERAESWTNGASLEGWRCSEGAGFFNFSEDARLSVVSNSLAVTFPPGPGMASPPFPTRLNATALTNSFGGRLHGDVAGSGATHLAFDFEAQFPVELGIRLRRSNYSTDGTLFTHQRFVSAGLTRVYVPLDAAQFELYDFFIGKPGFVPPYDDEFAATLENITEIYITIYRHGDKSNSPAETHLIRNVYWTNARISLDAAGANHGFDAVTNGSINVSSTIEWSATTPSGWVTLSSASGSGDGVVSYSLSPNLSTSTRTATITIAGLNQTTTFTITQAGTPPPQYLVAWPSALGFRYEVETVGSLLNAWSDAETVAVIDGDGSILEHGVYPGPAALYMRLKARMK